MPLAAFVGALAAVALVYRLSLVAGRRLDPRVLLLSGVVVGLVRRRADERHHRAVARGRDPERLPLAARRIRLGVLAVAGRVRGLRRRCRSAVIGLRARSLDLLALGDEPAHHLGADVERTRRLVYVCTALLTAASVATCGIIGFVGLVVPHAVRTVARPLHRTLLPLVFGIGGRVPGALATWSPAPSCGRSSSRSA